MSRSYRSGDGARRSARGTSTLLRALTAAQWLDAGVVVPIHWGTYSPIQVHSAPPPWLNRPAVLFDELMASAEMHDNVELLLPGASFRYRAGGVVRQLDP